MSVIVTKIYSSSCTGVLLNNINNNVNIAPTCEQILTDGSTNMYFYFTSALTPSEDTELNNILSSFTCPAPVNLIDDQTLNDNSMGTDVLWSSTKINSVITNNVDHVNLLNKGTNSHAQIDSHISNNNNPHLTSDNNLIIRNIGGSKTLSNFIDSTMSVGYISDGTITDGGSNTINVASGKGLIRSTNSEIGNIYFITWNATNGLSVPVNTTRYVYVFYNSGNPTVNVYSTAQTDEQQYIYLGEVHNIGGSLTIHQDKKCIIDFPNKTIHWVKKIFGTIVVSGETSYDPTPNSLKLAVTAGEFFDRYLHQYITPAFDSSVSGTFTTYYRNGTGGWNKLLSQTNIDNLNYDNNSGTLAPMTNTYYSCRYVIRGFNNLIYMIIGQAEYSTQALALDDPLPIKPEELNEHGFFITRIVIQKSATSPSTFKSIKPTVTGGGSSTSSNSHNQLAGLQGGIGNEYYHLSLSQYNGLHSNINDPSTSEKQALVGTNGTPSSTNKYVTDSDPRVAMSNSQVKVSSTDTTSNYLFNKLVAGNNISLVINNSGLNETITINSNPTGLLSDPGSNGIVVRNSLGVTISRSLIQPLNGLTITNSDGIAGNPTLALSNDLSALEGLASTGFAVRSATDTWVQRSFVAPSSGIAITNATGVTGNPTFSLANDLASIEALSGTGFAIRTAIDTWSQRILTAPLAGFTISNNDGVLGNPTFILSDDLNAVENISTTGIVKRTAINTWSTGTVDLITETNGTLSIAKGGTGQTTQTEAFDALAPTTTKGDIIVHNGTDNIRVPVGANNQVLIADTTQASGVKWDVLPVGEINTASNVGIGGVGVFKQKSGVNLEFKNINSGSSKLTITNDTVNNEIDIDIVESNLSLNNISGTLSIAKGGTGQTTQTEAFDALAPTTTKGDIIVHNGTDNIRVPVGANNQVLVADNTQVSGVKWAAQTGGSGGGGVGIEQIFLLMGG